MAKADVRFSKRALRDLDAIVNYIAEQGAPQAAFDYADRIEARCLALGDFPSVGRRVPLPHVNSLRTLPFESVIIVYRETAQGVRIAAIFGQRQDYARWLGRLDR